MAVRKKSTGTGTATEKSKKIPDDAAAARNRKIVLFFVLLVVLLALITGLIWLGLKIPNVLFKENPRFVLKRLEVTSSGYWHGRDREIAKRIGVNIGQPLFDINAGEVRKKALAVHSIDSCEVQVVLPDTLVLKLTERVPRAVLYPQTQMVVDEFGGAFIETKGLLSNAQKIGSNDIYHYCKESQRILGSKYFEKYQELRK